MRRDSLLQIIDVVNKDAVQFVQSRVDIARNGNINKEHGAITAAAQEQLTMLPAKDCMRSPRRGNDNIGFVAGVVQLFKHNGLPMKLLRELHGAVIGAVSNKNRSGSMRN